MVRLESGDYLINNGVLIERKTCSDFATSLADGRLFPQAAKLIGYYCILVPSNA